MHLTEQSSRRWRMPVVWAFFAYAFLMRITPYVLHRFAGMPYEGVYDAYPWNFSPLYALAIFGGAMFAPRMAWAAPLAVFVAGDLVIAALDGGKWGFYPSQFFTYLAIAAVVACGFPLRGRPRALPIGLAGVTGATAFWIITNLGVWLTNGGFDRPQTPAGLVACFVDAIPFYGPTLLSMAVFLPMLFSPLVLVPAVDRPLEPETAF